MRRILLAMAAGASLLAACSSGHSSTGGGPAPACHGALAGCSGAADCCSHICVQGLCAPSGNGGGCGTSNDCNYGLTCKSNVCVAGATCRDVSDVCFSSQDCCSSRCSVAGLCVADSVPVANAGVDHTAPFRSTVMLYGTSSADPDGDPLTYAWTLTPPAGSTATLSSPTSPVPSFYADVAGVYTAVLTVSDARSSSSATVHVTAQNYPPVASAGTNRTVPRNNPVTVDASASTDPDRDALSYSWTLTSAPAGSAATLVNAAFAQATFTPDLVGRYVATVAVSDGTLSTAASVEIDAINTPPVASVGAAQTGNVGTPVTLDGSASADPDHDPLTYAWTVTARPASSAATLASATSAKATFTPDVEGTYSFSLTVSDGVNTSPAATVSATAYHRITPLSHDVVDAEYSAALNQIVMVSATPVSALYLLDPETGTERTVALNKSPLTVSVGPDGKLAVVGHDGMLSYVDLSTATRLKELPVSVTVGDVVLGTGSAYVFPAAGAQWTNIYTVNLSTGATTLSSGSNSIYGGTRAKLHPSGSAIYGASNGLSPDNLENYAIDAKGVANYGWASPYWGTHSFSGDLWISQDGTHAFTRSGDVYNLTPTTRCITAPCGLSGSGTPSDMVYAGALQGISPVRHASHSSTAKKLVAIPDTGWYSSTAADTVFESFDDTYFTLVAGSSVALPPWAGPGAGYVTHGRFVFWRSDASKRYAIVQGDGGTPVASSFGVVAY